MSFLPIFDIVSGEFKQKGVSCVVVGGFAVNYYGAVRQTEDIDFLISEKDADTVSAILESAGYQKENSSPIALHFCNLAVSMRVDFLLVDQNSFDGIFAEAQLFTRGDISFYVASLEHVIALKLHAIRNNPDVREYTDLPDIINLIKVNHLDIRTESFKKMCHRYGSADLYARILKVIGDHQ